MHQTSGNGKLGFFLALLTAFMWGVLPIALKLLLEMMDAYTITWYRFLAAAALLGAYLVYRRKLPSLSGLKKQTWLLIIVAVAGLAGNYLLYLLGLAWVTPATAQMVIQLAPLFLILGGLVVFHEPFSLMQLYGVGVLLLGLALFFHEQLLDFMAADPSFYLGTGLILVAGVIWTAYALSQKQLLRIYRSEQIMFLLYLGSAIALVPLSQAEDLLVLDLAGWLLLIFCCLNTVVAYGAFAEALDHWEASRVSAVLATTPLITLATMWILSSFIRNFSINESFGILRISGAGLTVTGSMLTALGKSKSLAGTPARTGNISAADEGPASP